MMKPLNQAQISFDSRSVNESFGRAAVAAFLTQLDPTVADLTDMKTAVSEAVTNAIVHGYKDRRGTVYITAKLFENGKAVVRVRDKGCGIPDIKKAMEPLYTTGGDTMVNVCYQLGVECIEVVDYVIPQTDVGRLVGSAYAGMPVVGKGGLTGNDNTACDVVDRLFGETSRQ